MISKTWALLAVFLVILTQAPTEVQAQGVRRSPFRLGNRSPRPTYRVADASFNAAGYGRATVYQTQVPPAQAATQYRQAAYEPAPMPAEAAPAAATPMESTSVPAGGNDPHGFTVLLNQYRASMGLSPLSIDVNLSAWASQNNVAQSSRGLGHHINPNCVQNCAWNYGSVASVIQGWINSPGHRANLFNPSITRVGIAYGPGPYWTMNAQ